MNNGRPRQHGQRPTGTPSASGNRATGEPLKFDGEFDFEQANQRFTEEIEKAMDKLKVGDETKKSGSEDKNDSLTNSMSQELQDQAHIMMKQKSLESMDLAKEMQKQMDQKMLSKEDQDVKDFYDKNISFFDRISCESNEKMVSSQRPKSWKEERKVNAETFGLTQRSNDKSYRSYNYNNRNYHNRNYNGQRNYNNNNNQMNNSMTNSNSQNFNQRNGGQRQNYNQRQGQQNMNRGYNNNNGGYRQHRQEMEVNGNSQRRFGSR